MASGQNTSWRSDVWNQGFSPLVPLWVYFGHLRILVMRGVSNLPCRYSETVSKKVSWGCTNLKIAWIHFCHWLCWGRQRPWGSTACPFESQFFPSLSLVTPFFRTALGSHGKEQCVNINVEYLSLKIPLGYSTNLYRVCCGFLDTACLQLLDLLVYR